MAAPKKWRPYLDGKCTRIVTDHCPLTYLHTQPHLSPQQVWWMECLSAYKLEFVYHPVSDAAITDALSWFHTVVVERGCTVVVS